MNRYLLKLVIFTAPLFFWILIIYILDPYNYFSHTHSFSQKFYKYNNNFILAKVIEYKKKPRDYILLGDSKIANLDENVFSKYTGNLYSNLGYGGGSLAEIINTFWFIANENKNIKEVYIGLNLYSYSNTSSNDRVTQSVEIASSPYAYLLSQYPSESVMYFLKSKALLFDEKTTGYIKPTQSREAFWQHQLNSADKIFSAYSYPTRLKDELGHIAEYCSKHAIKLTFIIMPTHTDLQNLKSKYFLRKYDEHFLSDLRKYGDIYNFDFKNKITSNELHFNDPFHMDSVSSNLIPEAIFLKKSDFSEYSAKN